MPAPNIVAKLSENKAALSKLHNIRFPVKVPYKQSLRYLPHIDNQEVKPPRGGPRGIPTRMAKISAAFSPPSLKLRRALLAIHPHGKPWGFLAKESKFPMVIRMDFSFRSSRKKKISSVNEWIGLNLIFSLFFLYACCLSSPNAIANDRPLEPPNEEAARVVSPETHAEFADIVNPFKSTCYDWEGNTIPCGFKRPYAEILYDKTIPEPRFIDNKNGTVTDSLTGLIWLKNTQCFGRTDWEGAQRAAESLRDGDCGPDPALILSDGSSAGDWRLPTMKELCALIDYSRRNPALPPDQLFSNFPPGYYWSATVLDHHPAMAWIVYFESGTTCYDDIKNHAGHIWPVRGPKE
jgi:hypothetical protein